MKRLATKKRAIVAVLLCFALVMAVQAPAQAAKTPRCSTLYNTAKGKYSTYVRKLKRKASGSSQVKKCTFVGYKYRGNLKDCYYATDSKQIYCVCIVRAKSNSAARQIGKQFNSVLKSNKNNSYYKTTTEKRVVKAAKAGYKGKYAWYISLGSSSSKNSSAVSALKKKI